ncbi:MAG: hypothetical protein WDA27_06585 [Actinomycetota bacterium]
MKDIHNKLEEVAELAERTKEQRLRRFGRPPKPEGEVGQVYSIRIPVARIAELEEVAAARGEPPRTMLREWVLDRLECETHGTKRKPAGDVASKKKRSIRTPRSGAPQRRAAGA